MAIQFAAKTEATRKPRVATKRESAAVKTVCKDTSQHVKTAGKSRLVNLRVPDDLYRAFVSRCAEDGVTASESLRSFMASKVKV